MALITSDYAPSTDGAVWSPAPPPAGGPAGASAVLEPNATLGDPPELEFDGVVPFWCECGAALTRAVAAASIAIPMTRSLPRVLRRERYSLQPVFVFSLATSKWWFSAS